MYLQFDVSLLQTSSFENSGSTSVRSSIIVVHTFDEKSVGLNDISITYRKKKIGKLVNISF